METKHTAGARLSGLPRGKEITFFVNGAPATAFEGETVHAALIAAGYRQFRKSRTGQPRGIFCGMGVCYECLVTINGKKDCQSCMIPVAAGMEVELETL